jgi:hypothetical protein
MQMRTAIMPRLVVAEISRRDKRTLLSGAALERGTSRSRSAAPAAPDPPRVSPRTDQDEGSRLARLARSRRPPGRPAGLTPHMLHSVA